MPPSRTTSLRRSSGLRLLGVALAGAAGAASLTVASTASAGIIPESGWNLDNVTVTLDGTGSTFNPVTGDYCLRARQRRQLPGRRRQRCRRSDGHRLAKDWPIGEPPGIKIVNDDNEARFQDGRPNNCIMATSYLDDAFLDSTDPEQVLCSSGVPDAQALQGRDAPDHRRRWSRRRRRHRPRVRRRARGRVA